MKVESIRAMAKNFGISKTLYDLSIRAINRVMLFKILQGMQISAVDPDFLEIDGKYTHGFLDEQTIRRFAKDEEYEITEQFLEEALNNGSECYGILDGDTLASYGWYSNKPTKIFPEDLLLHFSDQYIYMYKGYTHRRYRGQRLHAIGMSWALKGYLEKGFAGLCSYVETTNFSSLKSVYRMNYKDIGKIYAARVFDRYLLHAGKGCKAYNFYLECLKPAPPAESPQLETV